jgi:hypothetical protein
LLEEFLEVPAVRLAQALLAAPAHLADPNPCPMERLPSYRVRDAVGCRLVEGSLECPAIVLSPPTDDLTPVPSPTVV